LFLVTLLGQNVNCKLQYTLSGVTLNVWIFSLPRHIGI
jgi:hypothetical protein